MSLRKNKKLVVFILVATLFFSSVIVSYAGAPDWLVEETSKVIGWVIFFIADGIHQIIDHFGLSIDNIVFNRPGDIVDGHPKNKLYFTFDEYSYFGVFASPLYDIFKNAAIIFMFCVILLLAIKIMTKRDLKTELIFRKVLFEYAVSFVLILYLPKMMPIIYDLLMDVVGTFRTNPEGLNFVEKLNELCLVPAEGVSEVIKKGSKAMWQYATKGVWGLDDAWDKLNEETYEITSLVNVIAYAGSVGLNLWFIFMYAYRNVMLSIVYVFSPITFLFMNGEKLKKVFEEWVEEITSLLLLPFIDAVLLFFVMIAATVNTEAPILTLILTMCIIPIRGSIRRKLGLGKGVSELTGLAAVTGVGMLAGRTVGGLTKGISGGLEGFQDIRSSRIFESSNSKSSSTSSVAPAFSSNLKAKNPPDHKNVTEKQRLDKGASEQIFKTEAPAYTSQPQSSSLDDGEFNWDDLDTRKKAMIMNLGVGAKIPKKATSFEDVMAYNLKRRGVRKMTKAAASTVFGAAGGAIGGALFLPLDPGVSSRTAMAGGMLGAGAGNIAGVGAHMGYDKVTSQSIERTDDDLPASSGKIIEETHQSDEIIDQDQQNNGNVKQKPVQFPKLNKELFNKETKDYQANFNDPDTASKVSSLAYENTKKRTGINPEELNIKIEKRSKVLYDQKSQNFKDDLEVMNMTMDEKEMEMHMGVFKEEAMDQARAEHEYDYITDQFNNIGKQEAQRLSEQVLIDKIEKEGFSSISTELINNQSDHFKRVIMDNLRASLGDSDTTIEDLNMV